MRCLSNPSPFGQLSCQVGRKCVVKDMRDANMCRVIERLCVAAMIGMPVVKEQLGFHPMKVFRALQKHHPDALLCSLFSSWPASEQNPFVMPVCLYSCMHWTDREMPYCTVEFIRMAQAQCARQYAGVPLLFAVLLYASPQGRLHAARTLVAAGVDPNEIACTARLKEFAPTWRSSSGSYLFARIDEVTPLALAVTLNDNNLVRELIQLGANPCLVCFHLRVALKLFHSHYQVFLISTPDKFHSSTPTTHPHESGHFHSCVCNFYSCLYIEIPWSACLPCECCRFISAGIEITRAFAL